MRPGGKVILLDLGGVVVEATARRALAELLPHLSDEQIVERWHQSRAVDDFERGRVAKNAFASAFVTEWGLEIPASEFVEQFASWVNGFVEGATDLIQSLRTRYHVGYLSNISAVHWAKLPELKTLFDSSFPSYVTGFMKPEREAYQYVLGELGVPPQDVYFFDDLESNVVAAREVGINAFRVRGFENLLEVLRVKGLYQARTPNLHG